MSYRDLLFFVLICSVVNLVLIESRDDVCIKCDYRVKSSWESMNKTESDTEWDSYSWYNQYCSNQTEAQQLETHEIDQGNATTCCDGYRELEQDTDMLLCEPSCSSECVNGKCTLPDNCECLDGYTLTEHNKTFCVPVCSEYCVHGECTAPDVCTCSQGYGFLPNSSNKCVPLCSGGCRNGICIGPEKCECDEGYILLGNKCKLSCSKPCTKGNCDAEEDCVCAHGYEKNQKGFCDPLCSQYCVNGECALPEVCTCNPGFLPHPLNRSVCVQDLHEMTIPKAYRSNELRSFLVTGKSLSFVLNKTCDSLIRLTNSSCSPKTGKHCTTIIAICERVTACDNNSFFCELRDHQDQNEEQIDEQEIEITTENGPEEELHFEFLLPSHFEVRDHGTCRMCDKRKGSIKMHWHSTTVLYLVPCSSLEENEKFGMPIIVIIALLLLGVLMTIIIYVIWKKYFKSKVYYVNEDYRSRGYRLMETQTLDRNKYQFFLLNDIKENHCDINTCYDE